MSMIERVAKALAENQFGNGAPVDDDDRSMARAAIEAMREPTDAMNNALDRVPGGFGRGAWLEGIGAALNEEVSA